MPVFQEREWDGDNNVGGRDIFLTLGATQQYGN